MKERIGVCLMALGLSTAGSEKMLVPLVLMGIGIFLIRGVIEW